MTSNSFPSADLMYWRGPEWKTITRTATNPTIVAIVALTGTGTVPPERAMCCIGKLALGKVALPSAESVRRVHMRSVAVLPRERRSEVFPLGRPRNREPRQPVRAG